MPLTSSRRVVASLTLVACALPLFGPPGALGQAARPAQIFMGASFLDAKAQAEAEGKLLYVNGVVPTCSECFAMDQEVFRNPRVQAWLQDNAVCVRIDAEAEPGEQLRLKLGPYPTHIFIRDSELIDRMEGALSPSEFLSLARGAARGRTTGQRIEEEYRRALRNGYDRNPDVRYAYAQKLLEHGRYEVATEEFAFLWTGVVSLDRRFARTRHDFAGMAGKIKELVTAHEPAREIFQGYRDALKERVDPERGAARLSAQDVRDWVVLNNILRDWPALIGWASDVAENHDRAILELGGEPLVDSLRTRFQWRLMGLVYDDPMSYIEDRRREYGDRLGNPTIDSWFLDKVADMYAACLAAGRVQEAVAIAQYAIAFKDEPRTYVRLAEKAELAGIPEDQRRVWPDGTAQGPPTP